MPVLGIAVLAGGSFLAGAGVMWAGMSRGIRDCLRENDQVRRANARLLDEVQQAYSDRVANRLGGAR